MDPAFVRKIVEVGLKGAEARCQHKVHRKATMIMDKNLAREFHDEAAFPEGTIDLAALCAAEIVQKHELLSTWTPEAGLLVALGMIATNHMRLVSKLDRVIAEIREERKRMQQAADTPRTVNATGA